jgi:hypothetical protein
MSFEDLMKPVDKDEMEDICNNLLGPNQPAQCISARFVDSNNKTVFVYFGQRVYSPQQEAPVSLSIKI